MRNLKCEVCDSGVLYLNTFESIEALSPEELLSEEQIQTFIDTYMDSYLVYTCNQCGTSFKYTDKEVLKKHRQIVLEYIMKQAVPVMVEMELKGNKTKVLKYCGKCYGQDGKGSCAIEVYSKCELKEFPVE